VIMLLRHYQFVCGRGGSTVLQRIRVQLELEGEIDASSFKNTTVYTYTIVANQIPSTAKLNTGRDKKLYTFFYFVRTIQINQPTRCNNFSRLLFDVYVQLNMFRASSLPSSGAQQMQ
jgi:hypothetical protein